MREGKENCLNQNINIHVFSSDSDAVQRSKEQPIAGRKEHSEEFDEQIIINGNVERLVSKVIEEAVEQILARDEKSEKIVPLSSNENDESSEQTVPILNNHKSGVHCHEKEEVYPSVILNEVTSIVPVGQTNNATIELPSSQGDIQQPVENNLHDQLQSETPQEQVVTSNDEDKQTLDQFEQIQTTEEADVEQTVPEVTEAKSLLSTSEEVGTVPIEETLNEKIDPLTIEIPSQSIGSSEEKEADILNSIRDEISVISNEKLEEPTALLTQSKPPLATTEVIEEKLEEPMVLPIESKPISTAAEKKEPIAAPVEPKPILATVVEIKEKLEEPIVPPVESKPTSTTAEKKKEKPEELTAILMKSKPVLVAAKNFAEKISEVSSDAFVNKPVKQTSEIVTQKEHLPADKKVNPSAQKDISKVTTSGEKSAILPDKQLEKPIVKEVPQRPFTPYGQHTQSTHHNKRFGNPSKKSIPTASSIQENSHARHELRLQPNTIVKQPEQRKNVVELPVQSLVTTPMRCRKYSDAVNQPVVLPKKQEQATVSKKKVASSSSSNETPKQSIIITEEIRPVPTETTTKRSEPPFVQHHQSNAVKEEANEETKKSRNKNKKSRRSNAKKANAKNNSANTEHSLQSTTDNGEEKEESEGSVHDEPALPPAHNESVIEVHTAPTNK